MVLKTSKRGCVGSAGNTGGTLHRLPSSVRSQNKYACLVKAVSGRAAASSNHLVRNTKRSPSRCEAGVESVQSSFGTSYLPHSDVEYSLGKKGRWLLPEVMVDEIRGLNQCDDSEETKCEKVVLSRRDYRKDVRLCTEYYSNTGPHREKVARSSGQAMARKTMEEPEHPRRSHRGKTSWDENRDARVAWDQERSSEKADIVSEVAVEFMESHCTSSFRKVTGSSKKGTGKKTAKKLHASHTYDDTDEYEYYEDNYESDIDESDCDAYSAAPVSALTLSDFISGARRVEKNTSSLSDPVSFTSSSGISEEDVSLDSDWCIMSGDVNESSERSSPNSAFVEADPAFRAGPSTLDAVSFKGKVIYDPSGAQYNERLQEKDAKASSAGAQVLIAPPRVIPSVNIVLAEGEENETQQKSQLSDEAVAMAACSPAVIVINTGAVKYSYDEGGVDATQESLLSRILGTNDVKAAGQEVFVSFVQKARGEREFSVTLHTNLKANELVIENLIPDERYTVQQVLHKLEIFFTKIVPKECLYLAERSPLSFPSSMHSAVHNLRGIHTYSQPIAEARVEVIEEQRELAAENRKNEEESGWSYYNWLPRMLPSLGWADSVEEVECSVCCEPYATSAGGPLSLSCGHTFCLECWRNHIYSCLGSGASKMFCLGCKCDQVVDPLMVLALCGLAPYKRYANNVTEVNLVSRDDAKWCPTSQCGRILRSTNQNAEIVCPCGVSACFGCLKAAHWPLTCGQATEYHKFLEQKGLLNNFKAFLFEIPDVTVMTRKCPSCWYPFEKYTSCNQFYCIWCTTSFCWVCLLVSPGYRHACRRACIPAKDAYEEHTIGYFGPKFAGSSLMRKALGHRAYRLYEKRYAIVLAGKKWTKFSKMAVVRSLPAFSWQPGAEAFEKYVAHVKSISAQVLEFHALLEHTLVVLRMHKEKGWESMDEVLFDRCDSLSFLLTLTEQILQTGFSKKAAENLELTWDKVGENVERLVHFLKSFATSSASPALS